MKKFKSFLLCLLAVSTAVVTGNSFADESFPTPDNSVEEQEEGKSAVSSKLAESVEKVAVSYADITEYLEKIGTVEGIDIYFKDKKIDDIIWEKHGGKPAKKSDYTPQQEKIADKIDGVLDAISGRLTEEERISFYRSLSIISDSLGAVAKNG